MWRGLDRYQYLKWFFLREKKSYLLGIVALLLIALIQLFPPYAVKEVVDLMASRTLTVRDLWFWTGLCLLAALIRYVLGYVWRIALYGAANRLGKWLRNQIFVHYTRMSPSFFHRWRTGDLMAHATNDIQAIVATAGDGVLTLVDSLITGGLVVLTMFFFIDESLTVVALLPMPVIAWTTRKYGKMMNRRFRDAQEAFSRMNGKAQENISGVRMVKAFGMEEAEKEAFSRITGEVADKNIAVARVHALFDPTIMLSTGFSFLFSIAYGSYLVAGESLTIGQLTQFTIYLGQLVWPMLAFGFLINMVERGRASYDRVIKLLEEESDVKDGPEPEREIPDGDIIIRVNRFHYPRQKTPALKDIHLSIGCGQTIGITGKTGSGKTTLIRLLLREFDVTDGEILFGSFPVERVSPASLRKKMGYVPQEHILFTGTVYENIAFAKPDAKPEEVEKAAKIASIHQDVLNFPDGYETIVGERGVALSGGQKQRISLARALITDPDVLILDDALSAVDARTEYNILKQLAENRKNKTTLIIAHRISAIESADWIIVLDQGQIIERGDHTSLMRKNGWYRHMYERQQLELW